MKNLKTQTAMKTETAKQIRNAKILNGLKTLKYTKKESLYAPLIIEILEAANNFDKKLDNCVVEHNHIEQMLYCEYPSFIHDEFGRRLDEMGARFITACKNLNKAFNKNNPDANDFMDAKDCVKSPYKYFGKEYNRERNFMQKLILKLVEPLKLKRVSQPIFVRVVFIDKGTKEMSVSWYSGTRMGNYIMGEEYTLPRLITKKEMRLIENEIEAWVRNNGNEIPEYDELCDFIENRFKPKQSKKAA